MEAADVFYNRDDLWQFPRQPGGGGTAMMAPYYIIMRLPRSKVSVGTTHRSMAAIACAWFRRNVFQLCEGGVPPRVMYLETVEWYRKHRPG